MYKLMRDLLTITILDLKTQFLEIQAIIYSEVEISGSNLCMGDSRSVQKDYQRLATKLLGLTTLARIIMM